MGNFDYALYFNAIYDYKDEDLISYLEKHLNEIPNDKKKDLPDELISKKKWGAFNFCIQHEIIHTELYEYNSFYDSIFSNLGRIIIYFKEDELADFLVHFEHYLSQIDDINETLQNENILSFSINNALPLCVLQSIINAGIQINYKDISERNYLHFACNQRSSSDETYVKSVLLLLLEQGLDVNAQDIEGKTPLYLAIDNQRVSQVGNIQILLENGADPTIEDKKGLTPFYIAAVYHANSSLTKLLFNFGTPDFFKLNNDGDNLLNAYLRTINTSQESIEILNYMLDNGADLSATSEHYSKEKSGLDWVAEKHSDILKHLIEKELIAIDETDNNGQTMLMKVCQVDTNYDENVSKDLYRKVKYLLKAGTDKLLQDRFDKKAIDYALSDNLKSKIVETLIEN